MNVLIRLFVLKEGAGTIGVNYFLFLTDLPRFLLWEHAFCVTTKISERVLVDDLCTRLRLVGIIAKEYAKKFYNSKQWKECRIAYLKSKGYVCERCGELATMVHHKEYISVDNCSDPNILTNFDNLEALCHECHNKEHERFQNKSRYKINTDGTISIK